MSEACPLGLNYGHFGEPSYDSENHEWHFPRQAGRTRELKRIGRPVTALESPLRGPTVHVQSATERARNIKSLTRQHPETQPASALLPGLAHISEVVNVATSGHDPTVSELLAIGEAVDLDKKSRGCKTVPIAAIAGGEAGEAVRLVLLTNEKLSWEDSKNIHLSAFSSKGGEEGRWFGNGSPIQQLIFAEAEGRPSSWLAVRYHGAVSVLRPQLRRNTDMLPLASTTSARNFPSRLNANHIATLSIGQANGEPYSDVTFNPWYNQQIATIDQKGTWAVWDIEKLGEREKERRFWTVKKVRDGSVLDVLPAADTTSSVADGWGVVLWAGSLSTILVARRRKLAVFDITGDPKALSVPELLLENASEWILDVKRSSQDLSQIFVATTSSIFWLQVANSAGNHEGEDIAAGAKCLLSWTHFRDPEDLSLSLRVADDFERDEVDDDRRTTLVLLYSRLTGLTNVFTFQYARSYSNLTPSTSDPYFLSMPHDEPYVPISKGNPCVSHTSSKISALSIKAVKYESPMGSIPSGLGQIYLENDLIFYQLSLLTNDLTLTECLYVDVHNDLEADLRPPDIVNRFEIAKTPANIISDFIVPDGYVDQEYEDSQHHSSAKGESDAESGASLALHYEDPYTIPFDWLDHEYHSALTNASFHIDFHDHLDLLQNEIEDMLASEISTMSTLFRIENARVSVLDLDEASGNFVDFIDGVRRLTLEYESGNDQDVGKKLAVSSMLTPKLRVALGISDNVDLSSIYEDLIQTWIVSLSRQVPARVRIALEKILRDVAGQICLASYAMRIDSGPKDKDVNDQPDSLGASAGFVLPVRRRTSASDLGKGKERSDAVSSLPQASSQMTENTESMPQPATAALPTPEPTPSLRSRSSVSSLINSEDPASERLRVYASLAPQSSLPAKLSNLHGQWQLGSDPSQFDGGAAVQAAIGEGQGEGEAESQTRQRQRLGKQRKRQRESSVGPSSQPEPSRLWESQPQQGQDTQDAQGSSQRTLRAVTRSQVEPGKFGGRHTKGKKLKVKARPAGFK